MSRLVELVDDIAINEWIEFSRRGVGTAPDQVTVAFARSGSKFTAVVRLGIEVLERMRWKEKDKVGLFFSKHNKYKWMLCASSHGYKITNENNCVNVKKVQFVWPHDGVTYTKIKPARYEINQEKLIITVPM